MKRFFLVLSVFLITSFSGAIVTFAAPDDDLEEMARQQERERIMEDMNTFLIDSYKLKIDKILQELTQNVKKVAKDDPRLQKRILERIIKEVDAKAELLHSRNVSPNRKKVLSAIFDYIKTSMESKIQEATGENKN